MSREGDENRGCWGQECRRCTGCGSLGESDVLPNGIENSTMWMGARRAWRWRRWRWADERIRAGSAGISNISGAWAALPSVIPLCVPKGIEKATRRMGGRRAWRR
jgi:hypothetical protein